MQTVLVPLHFDLPQTLPPVPKGEYDRYGNWVDLTSNTLVFHDPSLGDSHFGKASRDLSNLGENIRHALMLWIAHSIKVHSPQETGNQASAIYYMLKRGGLPRTLDELNLSWWQSLRQTLRAAQEYRMSRIRAWYLWMNDQGWPGIDTDVADVLDGWRIRGNVKGEAVASADPAIGPLTENQFAHLHTKIVSEANRGVTLGLCAIKLCMNWGPNAKNLMLLEERDLSWKIDPETKEREYYLEIPRIKKRLAERQTKTRFLLQETGEMLCRLIECNRRSRCDQPGADTTLMPILCRDSRRAFPVGSPFVGRFDWHCTSEEITAAVRKFSEDNDLTTPGGTQRFRLSVRRLRYTFATRLAATGAPEAAIAEALDHSDLQNVRVYINATGELADRVETAIGPLLKPWVDKFVNGPKDSTPPAHDPRTIIHPDPKKFVGIGHCGLKSQCHLYPPLTCYGCDFFHPWKDADHSSVLNRLEALKADLVAKRADAADRIPLQYDGVIHQVRLIIAAQSQLKEEL